MNKCQYCEEALPFLRPEYREATMGLFPLCTHCETGHRAILKTLFQVLREHDFILNKPMDERVRFWLQPHTNKLNDLEAGKHLVYDAVDAFVHANQGPVLPGFRPNSLWIHGQLGTGKTEALLTGAAQLVVWGHGFMGLAVIDAAQLLGILRSANQFDGTYQKLLNWFGRKTYLLIDDLYFTDRKDDERIWTDLFTIRHNNHFPTLVTSMNSVENTPSLTDFLYARILDDFIMAEMGGGIYRHTQPVRWE